MHHFITESTSTSASKVARRLLVERLGVGGGGSDVGIAGSLVGAGLLLEGLGGSKVSATGFLVGLLVLLALIDEVGDGGVGKEGKHCNADTNVHTAGKTVL